MCHCLFLRKCSGALRLPSQPENHSPWRVRARNLHPRTQVPSALQVTVHKIYKKNKTEVNVIINYFANFHPFFKLNIFPLFLRSQLSHSWAKLWKIVLSGKMFFLEFSLTSWTTATWKWKWWQDAKSWHFHNAYCLWHSSKNFCIIFTFLLWTH